MRYSGITTCDITNGEGIGVVLWCQGCDLRCPGCHNTETWSFDAGKEFTLRELDELFQELNKPYITRLTLSGGHPLAPNNITTATAICREIKLSYPNKKIWVYTGYLWEEIKDYAIMKYIDVLVDGAYEEDKRDITLAFRGSSNQRIIDVQKSLETNEVVLK